MTSNHPPNESNANCCRRGRSFRLAIRMGCLVAAICCLVPVFGKDFLLPLVPGLSAFVAIASLVATRTFHTILILGLAMSIVAVFRHRWFCRWVCPTGLCLDGASYLGRRLKRKPARPLPIGGWLLSLTLGGAVLGLPLFLWLDPLAIFAGVFLAGRDVQPLAWHISAMLFLFLLVVSVLCPHIWCRGFCPLGALQDLLAMTGRGVRSVLVGSRHKVSSNRTGQPVARRTVLTMLVGATGVFILRLASRVQARRLRPPGAVDEDTFRALCTRCGNCIRACPHDIIRRDTDVAQFTSALTPVLAFDKDYCREDCNRCTVVCPSAAITPVGLEDKPRVRIGLPQVDMKICLLGEDRECSACMRWCPYNAVRYVFSEAEYTLTPVIDPEKCNGCGACQKACPTTGKKAITIRADIDQPLIRTTTRF